MTAQKRARGGAPVWLLGALWAVTLFDIQWLASSRGIAIATRIPVLLFPTLAVALVLTVPSVREWSRRWTWYAPLAAFIAVVTVTVPLAPNGSLAWDGLRFLLLYWTLVVATVTLVSTARRAEFLLKVFALQFLWWGLWGATTGLVFWSPVLANYDAFGAYMVIGAGFCSFMIVSIDARDRKSKWLRRALFLTVGLAAVGMVASFARGAFLAALVVAALVWARSPNKGKTFAAGVGAAILVSISAALLFGDAYWAEMSTILEGTGEQTGDDRWQMWQAAFGVFLQHPILGVGYDNWGVFASTFYRPGDLGGNYGLNPSMLWGRQAHNSYITVLAEHGILGMLMFGWIIWDFFRRNAALRTEAAARRWRELGGRFHLPALALGLEAAFVGWMAAAALYSMAGAHWFYTLLALNLTIHALVTIGHDGPRPKRVATPRGGAAHAAPNNARH